MRVKVTDDKEHQLAVRQALRRNEGYCPCKLEHIHENECMCLQFLNGPIGPCHCGLYIKTQE